MTTDRLRMLEWQIIPAAPLTAHMHMALDEVLLGEVTAGRRPPVLRMWQWSERALVIGSHQSVVNEVDVTAAGELGFALTRRMSGGGTMLCEPGGTITYSLYVPENAVEGVSFRASYALLDSWAVEALRRMGIPAAYREINDIISPRGKIAGAAQARRRGFVLHHTTMAHSMDVALVPRLIRIGRDRLAERGVRSAEKEVSPLAWFTALSCEEVARNLAGHFKRELQAVLSSPTPDELSRAEELVAQKYGSNAWIHRLP